MSRAALSSRALAVALALALAACGDDAPEPMFPADYATSYVEVRDCRSSSEHDLRKVRILADPAALDPYTTRAAPFPVGAIVLKEEYDFADGACAGPILEWTAMRRLEADATWAWERVDADRAIVSTDDARCRNCHASCGRAPDGHDGTCAMGDGFN